MKKFIYNKTINICLIIYVVNEVILKKTGNIFFIGYLNDILAPIILFEVIKLLNDGRFKFSYIFNLNILIIASFWWEVVTPIYKNSTFDKLDFLAYIVGFHVYIIINYMQSRRISRWKVYSKLQGE